MFPLSDFSCRLYNFMLKFTRIHLFSLSVLFFVLCVKWLMYVFIPSENTKTTLIDALLRVAGEMFLLSSRDRGTASAGSQQMLPNMFVAEGRGFVGVHEAWADT